MSKYLTLLLILTLSLPPLQAGSCDIEQQQPIAPQGHQHAMDSDMPADAHPMAAHNEHKAVEHFQSYGQSDDMSDCCDMASAEQNQDCGETMDCGSCSAFASVISSTASSSSQITMTYRPHLGIGELVPGHDYPPFRPPMS